MSPKDEDVTTTRRVLSQKISAYLDTVQAWKEEYNAYADTSKLPPELLAMIFLSVADVVHEGTGSPQDMLGITQVCRHWRTVALQCQDLWSYVSLQPQRKTRVPNAFLPRAGNKLLKVSLVVEDCGEALQRSMQDLKDLIPRTSSLVIYFDNSLDPDCVEGGLECLCWPAPNLRSLTFKSAVRYSDDETGFYLFNSELPRLQHLSLDWGIPFDWDDCCFVPTLTHLNLSVHDTPFIPQILRTMRRLPLLQAFTLKHRGTDFLEKADGKPPRLSKSPVRMDHLQKLHLVAHPHIVAGLCLSLVFPSNAELTLVCDDGLRWSEGRFAGSLWPLLSWVAEHYVHSPSLYTRFLRINRLKSTRFCHHLVVDLGSQRSTKYTHWCQLGNPQVRLQISVHFTDDYPEYWSAMIPKITTALSSTNIETIHLDHIPDITNCVEVLSQFTGVRSIRLSGPFSFTILEQLSQTQDPNEVGATQETISTPLPPPIPSLHTIVFSEVQTMDSVILTNFLRWRKAKGHPVQQLWLERCYMDPTLIREVRQLGLVVEGTKG